MNQEEITELANKLYKLTLLFPKKEPLRYKMREVANRILENYISLKKESVKADLELMDSYFEIAKWQNWVSYFDILSLKEQYGKIKDNLPEKKEEKIVQKEIKSSSVKISERQKKIIKILEKKEIVQVWEINKILTNVSKRTLRRDFEYLLKEGVVKRMGERNKTFYKLVRTLPRT